MTGDVEPSRIELWLVGFRLDPHSDGEADAYTLYLNTDRPLAAGGHVVFFRDPSLAAAALARDDDLEARTAGPPPTDVHIVYDVALALYLLSEQDHDDRAEIINCLNVLLDMLKVIGDLWLDKVKGTLYPLADHLTFNREYGSFLAEESGRRTAAVDDIYWALGVVLAHSTFVRP